MQDCKDTDILVVTTTVGSEADAQVLARAIVEQRLAACVQVEAGLTSFYRWEGRLAQDPELRLTIKTLPHCAAPLQALFAQLHPYELPQFLAFATRASQAYAAWARAEVIPAPGSGS